MGLLLDIAKGAQTGGQGSDADLLDIRCERQARLRQSFDLVMVAFRAPSDEIDLAWSIALDDLPAAEACFHADAAMIRAGWAPLEVCNQETRMNYGNK